MSGLSHGVVRVDQENSLTSLTLQDCGQVLPGATLIVIKVESTQPQICKTDEVGEICMASTASGSSYWGLPGLTNQTFKLRVNESTNAESQSTVREKHSTSCLASKFKINYFFEILLKFFFCFQGTVQSSTTTTATTPALDQDFVRSGLLGFLGPGGLVFVCGSREGLMTVTGRKHNTDDIIATVLAVEPMKFIYRGRIAVFSIRVLRDERICVVAEQRYFLLYFHGKNFFLRI